MLDKLKGKWLYNKQKANPGFAYNHGPVHEYFGLTYASYLVLPRRAIQSMSWQWQEKFTKLMHEYEEDLGHVYDEEGPVYSVTRKNRSGRFIRDPLAQYRHKEPLIFSKEDV